MINTGEYDQRVTLQQRAAGLDAHGQESNNWTDTATVWARARPLRGRDFVAAAQGQASLDVQFRIRYRSDVDSTWRLLWNDQPYDIVGKPANLNGAGEELEINAVAGVRSGH